jgi:ribosomal protein S18 acetylase RimI-like enzyme
MTAAPDSDVVIAPSTEADLPAIRALAHQIWPICFAGVISDNQIRYMLGWMYSIKTMTKEVREGGISYDRLLAGGRLIGYTAHGPDESPGEWKLYKLYLHPDHQRRGYGTMLIRHVEQAARARACRALVLRVNRGNAQAIAVYRKNGFTVRESIVADIGHGFVMDDFVMAKPL